jgi:hypothetical protein
LHADIAAARLLRPGAEVMLINGASAAVERAEHVLAGHTAKAEWFVAARHGSFPDAQPFRVHATWHVRSSPFPVEQYPSVTDWHTSEMNSGATSAGKAIRICLRALGADEVILCGVPLDGSGYSEREARVPHDCKRVGDPKAQMAPPVLRYRTRFAELAQTEWKGRVFSMSGFTRKCLGPPP